MPAGAGVREASGRGVRHLPSRRSLDASSTGSLQFAFPGAGAAARSSRPRAPAVLPCPAMPTLRDLIEALTARADVASAVVLGRDGLLVDAGGLSGADAEHLAAVAPGVASAADAVGAATGDGALTTAVLEFGDGLAVVTVLSRDVLLLVRLAPGAEPAPLVFELRRSRMQLTALV